MSLSALLTRRIRHRSSSLEGRYQALSKHLTPVWSLSLGCGPQQGSAWVSVLLTVIPPPWEHGSLRLTPPADKPG